MFDDFAGQLCLDDVGPMHIIAHLHSNWPKQLQPVAGAVSELEELPCYRVSTALFQAPKSHPQSPENRSLRARRVDSLEQLVHSTLAELVTIANEAGVPTGGKAPCNTLQLYRVDVFVFCLKKNAP